MYKKLIHATLLALVTLCATAFSDLAHADDGVNVVVNGVHVDFDGQTPLLEQNRTLVPLRGVFETIGFVVGWDEHYSTATLSSTSFTVTITADSDVFYTNGIRHVSEIPAQIIGGRVMLPLRAAMESIGYDVIWSAITRTIYIDSPRQVRTLAGMGTHGYNDGRIAQFNLPAGIFSDGEGTIFVADTYNNLIRRISPDGNVTTFAGEIQGNDEYGFPLGRYRAGALSQALFNRPTAGVAIDGAMFIADSGNHIIRRIENNNVSTFATETGESGGDSDMLYLPTALAVATCGSIYFTDTLNHVVRRIGTDGNVTTVAGVPGEYGYHNGTDALFNSPMGIAVAENGMIFVADTGNHLIRVIENGSVRTFAGTFRTSPDFDNEPYGDFADGFNAAFNLPVGLALWGNNLIVADSANHRIRVIMPTGETVTLAGTGYPDATDGAANVAAFHLPRGVYVLGDLLYIADTGNNLIRVMPLN
ncbi:MAG: stalk domain-containing protein [Defluviitaleaceae bacterium]|nr:stalk domain-containing protein [Defluviitaleaceae bacterium]